MDKKPILFNTEMVRAILEGRKTVTRRVIKPRYRDDEYGWTVCINSYTHLVDDVAYTDGEGACTRSMKPPYQVGDILYVRETWGFDNHNWLYKADFSDDDLIKLKRLLIWHPSIHMPKEAARIFLKVTDVRVERLQDITDDQALKEGAIDNRGFIHSPDDEYDEIHTAGEHFKKIWDSTINKQDLDSYGWDANPWVWVIEFERMKKENG